MIQLRLNRINIVNNTHKKKKIIKSTTNKVNVFIKYSLNTYTIQSK